MKEGNIKSPIQLEDTNTYVIKENINKCAMCENTGDLRLGWCFGCAEAQNILATGKDMFEDEEKGDFEIPIKIVNERLAKLISKGWKKVNKAVRD